MPNMPSPFTPFLEENANSEENLKHLEHERKHAYETVKMMQKQLKQIDKRIREIKKQQHVNSPQRQIGTSETVIWQPLLIAVKEAQCYDK